MRVEAVVFDIGGVLELNPETGWPSRWADRLAISREEFDRRLGLIWGPGSIGDASLRQIEEATASAFGLDPAALSELMDDAWAEYVGTLNRELADYFAGLRPCYRTGILSNSFVGAREREHEAHHLGDLCDVIVYSHEAGVMKPDPRSYACVCDRLDVDAGSVVFLDDVAENVTGALAVGMQAVLFQNNQQAIADLDARLAD